MGNAPKQPLGNLSVLEKALSKKMKPMKNAASRPKASADFVKGSMSKGGS